MKSQNFEFIRPYSPELADLGGFAEQYACSDPAGSLVKLRKFGESMVAGFLAHYEVPCLPKSNFLEMLRLLEHQNLVPPVILNKLHALRTQGNKAAHTTASKIKPQIPRWILEEAFDLAKWYTLSLHKDERAGKLEFVFPEAKPAQEKKTLLRQLAAQEAQMQKLLADLEESRTRATPSEKTPEQRDSIRKESTRATSILDFNEETTRQLLVDQLLIQAGWDVGPGARNTREVRKEVELHLTSGKMGRADYVLWNDDGKPLAVIEAKRTAHDAEKGRTQAKVYAEALEAQHGQRPVIMYTNGYDIYLWDDAKGDIPRRIYGFYSKESLQRCLWETQNRTPLSNLAPRSEMIDRRYQIEAVKRVCEQFDQKRRKALIVQATGTGKTRVAIALSELLLRAQWAKRILFLCDRRELRKQANNAFAEFIDSEPRLYVTASSANDRNNTIYLATYPAMMKCFENFDVGFFDLVIADESHRSIYNRYRDLFSYFDALQVGLTATPGISSRTTPTSCSIARGMTRPPISHTKTPLPMFRRTWPILKSSATPQNSCVKESNTRR